eukprot:4945563-Prymnesium_polylepis.1
MGGARGTDLRACASPIAAAVLQSLLSRVSPLRSGAHASKPPLPSGTTSSTGPSPLARVTWRYPASLPTYASMKLQLAATSARRRPVNNWLNGIEKPSPPT